MKKITIATFLALILNVLIHVESLWSLFNLITQKTGTSVSYSIHWINIVSFFGIFISLAFLIYKYQEIRELMLVNNFISSHRNKSRFIEQFNGIEYYKIPNETIEDFFSRIPEGMYQEELKKEYCTVLNRIINEMDIKKSEAIKLLQKAYNFNPNKKGAKK